MPVVRQEREHPTRLVVREKEVLLLVVAVMLQLTEMAEAAVVQIIHHGDLVEVEEVGVEQVLDLMVMESDMVARQLVLQL
jgi:hypothetical protein